MQIKRQFFALDGTALNPDKLAQNTVFLMVIEGPRDGRAGTIRRWSSPGFPRDGKSPAISLAARCRGMDWLGTLSTPDFSFSQAAADDRYAAALTLGGDQADFRLAVMLRAVTPGAFEYPGMVLADMYRPQIFARQNTVHITVLPPAP